MQGHRRHPQVLRRRRFILSVKGQAGEIEAASLLLVGMNVTNARRQQLLQAIADLNPGYFALVMATGIVSVATNQQGWHVIATVLFAINLLAYVVLWLLTLARVATCFPRVAADVMDHARSPGFFTLIAGTCVIGSQCITLVGNVTAALVLWLFSAALWFVFTYAFFALAMVRSTKPSLGSGIDGSWLLTVVATQAVVFLGALLAPHIVPANGRFLFAMLVLWMAGCMLYLLIIGMIFQRLIFLPISAQTLTSPYWINMGALAITTLAGAKLILMSSRSLFISGTLPFLKGFTLFFWAAGTWWIPLFIVLGAWRYLVARYPVRYSPEYWAMVFPLGMYAAATYLLAHALSTPPLLDVARVGVYIALLAWVAVFAGMLLTLARTLTGRPAASSEPDRGPVPLESIHDVQRGRSDHVEEM